MCTLPAIFILFFRREALDDKPGGAMETDFDTDLYTVSSETNKLFPLRVRLQEDRIMRVEKKFFCDRTTEKTLTLTVSFVKV